jgi:hypothetical protein
MTAIQVYFLARSRRRFDELGSALIFRLTLDLRVQAM